MADIRDKAKYMAGRWSWTAGGYEKAFPRGIGFSDIDAMVEYAGCFLVIEAKHHVGTGWLPLIPAGQELMLKRLARQPHTAVFVLYGDAQANLPHAARRYRYTPAGDLTVDFFDWRADPIAGREALLGLFCQFVDWAEGQAVS